jgi:hypothetical protein
MTNPTATYQMIGSDLYDEHGGRPERLGGRADRRGPARTAGPTEQLTKPPRPSTEEHDMTTKTPETVTIDGHTFRRPFKPGPTFAATLGLPLDSWVVDVLRPGGEQGLTVPDARVFEAFGMETPR